MELKSRIVRDERGQAVTEYILLLAIIAAGFLAVGQGLSRVGIAQKLLKPINEDFARAYRYGHPKAKGFDDGGPEYHPRIYTGTGSTNFRMFMSPKLK